jgi:hypothetical protein
MDIIVAPIGSPVYSVEYVRTTTVSPEVRDSVGTRD